MRGLLVYTIRSDFPPVRGLVAKMHYQRAGFAELVDRVDVVCNSLRAPVYNGAELAPYRLQSQTRLSRTLNHYALFFAKILREIPVNEYDFFYIRFPGSSPMFLAFLAALRRRSPKAKIVLEIPTYPFEAEYKTVAQRLIWTSNELTHRFLGKYVDFIVTFFGQSSIYGIDCVATANGIDVKHVPLNRRRDRTDDFRLLAVANIADWHGYDRVIRGMVLPNDGANPKKKIHFDIVGEGPARPALEDLAVSLGVGDRVHFRGIQTGAALDAAFAECDVAVGSIGEHRRGHATVSGLKTREYCARGVPFVLAGTDPDFPVEWPFAFRVANEDSALDVCELARSYDAMAREFPDYPERMRRYAEERLTWAVKLRPVVERLHA